MMYALFLFSQFANCYEEISLQNTKGLRQLNIENSVDETIVFEAKSSQSQVSILLICDTAPNFQNLEDIYNDSNFGCICDWNAFDFSEASQKVMLIRNSTNNMISYSKNVKYTNSKSPYVGIFSKTYDFVNIYIYPKQSNDCIVQISKVFNRNCKYNGECNKGSCLCEEGHFGFDCKYQGFNIFDEEYLMKSSFYYVDLKSCKDANFSIQFKKQGKLSYQCFSTNPYLRKAKINNTDNIYISREEINNCLHQGDIQFGVASYYIIQIYQDELLYIKKQDGEDFNNNKTILIAILSTCLSFLCCLIFCVFKCYRTKRVVINPNANVNRILMNLQENKTTIDQTSDINEFIPIIQYSAIFKKYPQILDFSQCAICLDTFNQEQQVRVTYCQHVFHSKCFDAWIKKNSSCPICRSSQDKRTIKQQEKLQTIISQNTEFNPEVTTQKQAISRTYGETPMLTNHRSVGSSKYIQSNI